MSAETLILFTLAGLLLNVTPGPDALYIVTTAIRKGVRAGIIAALGITTGCFVHIVAASVGISAVLTASNMAFAILKWIGAAYLIYTGVRLLRSTPETTMRIDSTNFAERSGKDLVTMRTIFLRGFLTNALNVKVAVFFLAFLPQFIEPQIEQKSLALFGLGLLFNFNAMLVNIGWAMGAAWLATRIKLIHRLIPWLDKLAGAIFISFGIKLVSEKLPHSISPMN